MDEKEKILNTGTLYWFKSQRRGRVPIPLDYLSSEQKKTLSAGVKSNRYGLSNPYQLFTAHYMWVDNASHRHFLVTDIEIPLEVKRKLSPTKPARKSTSYKITLSDMNRLLDELRSGKVDGKEVKRIFSNTPWKPWIEKEWILRRDTVIQNACRKCGSGENLVLQHTVQPRKINTILYDLVGERYTDFKKYAEQHKDAIALSFPKKIKKVPVCPKCGSSRVHIRERGPNAGTYVCNKGRNYEVCKHQFVTPDYGYSESDIKQAEKRRMALLRNRFCEQEGLLRIAAEISLEEVITYLNFDHTKTLCRECAFKEDRPFEKYW